MGSGLQKMSRFYPDIFPLFPYEPTTANFAIEPIGDGIGVGVVSKRRFRKGELVFRFTGVITHQITQYTLQRYNGEFLHDPWFMGRILHRCEPNCFVDMTKLEVVAVRDIEPDEWVTMDYDQTEDYLFRPFVCNCGTKKCITQTQRVVRGNKDYDRA